MEFDKTFEFEYNCIRNKVILMFAFLRFKHLIEMHFYEI
jgi:hypothetical protein